MLSLNTNHAYFMTNMVLASMEKILPVSINIGLEKYMPCISVKNLHMEREAIDTSGFFISVLHMPQVGRPKQKIAN